MMIRIFELIAWSIAGVFAIITLIIDNADGLYIMDYVLCWISLLVNIISNIIQQYNVKEIFKENNREIKLYLV